MKKLFPIFLILLLSLAVFGQKVLPPKEAVPLSIEHSSVYDIRNFVTYYILRTPYNSTTRHAKKVRQAIVNVLKSEPSIKLSDGRTHPDFYIDYSELKGKSQMRVYYIKDLKQIFVWAEDRKTKGSETELTEEFLKVLQRNKKLDEQGKSPADA